MDLRTKKSLPSVQLPKKAVRCRKRGTGRGVRTPEISKHSVVTAVCVWRRGVGMLGLVKFRTVQTPNVAARCSHHRSVWTGEGSRGVGLNEFKTIVSLQRGGLGGRGGARLQTVEMLVSLHSLPF